MDTAKVVKRGLLIVFEGLDKAGKSTQTTLLRQALVKDGIPCSCFYFPQRFTHTGRLLDSYLNKAVVMHETAVRLLFSANRWEARDLMVQYIQEGTSVVVDRYAYSGVAYSTAKGLKMEECKSSDAGLPLPDLVFFVDTDPVVASQRDSYGAEVHDNVELQREIRKCYETLLVPDVRDGRCFWLSGNKSPEALHAQILNIVYQEMKKNLGALQCNLWQK